MNESELIAIRIAALERRIERERDFTKRMLALQRAGKGIADYADYDSLRATKRSHLKSKKKKKKTKRRFYTWDWATISPYQVIADARKRINMLKQQQGESNEQE